MPLTKAKLVIGSDVADESLQRFASDFCLPNFGSEYTVFPGFCDVHVHLREPGFSYKETILTGTRAAARGGYTSVCSMPNVNPVPDCMSSLVMQCNIIAKDAEIDVFPYGTITCNQAGNRLSDMAALAGNVIAFSDDGKGVQSEDMMRLAMQTAKSLGKIIAAHCEVNELLNGGYIHDGEYARKHGLSGISSASEYEQIARDIELARATGCAYHVCHISTKESVELIRRAKAEGVDITCETAPHYLVLDENDLRDEGRFKMNPPLRTPSDRTALVEGIIDGTIDMIATDHAPHSEQEKARGLKDSPFGIVGLETAFPILYTRLVREGIIGLEKLIDLVSVNPRRRFGKPVNGYSVWNLDESYVINPDEFLSLGRATPFAGDKVYGKNYLTVCNGNAVYKAI